MWIGWAGLLTEKIKRAECDRSQHSGRDEGNDEIRQPVRRDCNTDSLGAYARWKHFGRHNPVDAADGEGEVGYVYPDKYGSSPPRCVVRRPAILVHGIQGTNDELRDSHTDGSDDENLATTPSVEESNSWQS
jgi:hypothetical protein